MLSRDGLIIGLTVVRSMANGAKTNLQEDVLAGFRIGIARVGLQIAGAAGHRTFRSVRLHLAEGSTAI